MPQGIKIEGVGLTVCRPSGSCLCSLFIPGLDVLYGAELCVDFVNKTMHVTQGPAKQYSSVVGPVLRAVG